MTTSQASSLNIVTLLILLLIANKSLQPGSQNLMGSLKEVRRLLKLQKLVLEQWIQQSGLCFCILLAIWGHFQL